MSASSGLISSTGVHPKLLELISGPATNPAVVDLALGWVSRIGKDHLVVNDFPGFATSRLGVLIGLETIRMLGHGVADAASIDSVMELSYRHALGPLCTTDLVGPDVRLAIAEYLHAELGERFAPPSCCGRGWPDASWVASPAAVSRRVIDRHALTCRGPICFTAINSTY